MLVAGGFNGSTTVPSAELYDPASGTFSPTGAMTTQTGGRPAALFRFRREVLQERPAPGLGARGRR